MSRRRRLAVWLLLVAFVAVPLIEIYVIVRVGQVIGAWWTILLLVVDGLLGSWLVRHEGSRAWRALTEALQTGRMPATELADGALILIGGTLMLTPGFVTDLVGVLMVLPVTRPVGRRVLARVITRRLRVVDLAGDQPWNGRGPGPGPEGPVVRGDVVE